MRYYFKLTKTIIKMEIKTIKDLKNWIAELEEKFGTDNANLTLFAKDDYGTNGFYGIIYKDMVSYNPSINTIHMDIFLKTYEDEENVKITKRKW